MAKTIQVMARFNTFPWLISIIRSQVKTEKDEMVYLHGIPGLSHGKGPPLDKLFPGTMRVSPTEPAAIKFMKIDNFTGRL